MATIINTPGSQDRENSAAVWVIGLIVIVLLVLFAMFVWPNYMNGAQATGTPTQTTNNSYTNPTPANNYNTTINSTSTTNNIEASTTLPI